MLKWLKNIFVEDKTEPENLPNESTGCTAPEVLFIPSEYVQAPANITPAEYSTWWSKRSRIVTDNIRAYITAQAHSWYMQRFNDAVSLLREPPSTVLVSPSELFNDPYISSIVATLGTISCSDYKITVSDTGYSYGLYITNLSLAGEDDAQPFKRRRKSAVKKGTKAKKETTVKDESKASYNREYYQRRKEEGLSRYHYLRKIITDPEFATTCSEHDREMAARLDARNKRTRKRTVAQKKRYSDNLKAKRAKAKRVFSDPKYAATVPEAEREALTAWYNKRLSSCRTYHQRLKLEADKYREIASNE